MPQHDADDIWAPNVRLNGFTSPNPTSTSCNVASELARFRAMKSLRSKFTRLITEHSGGKKAPPLAFDRWLARSALGRATTDGDGGDHENETGGSISREPLLPMADGTNPGLISDLSRAFPRAQAVAISDAISASSRLAAEKHDAAFYKRNKKAPDGKITKKLVKATKRAAKRARKSNGADDDPEPWLELERAAEALRNHASLAADTLKPSDPPLRVNKTSSRGGDIILLSAMDADGAQIKPYMSLNRIHYEKLTELYRRFGGGERAKEDSGGESAYIDSLIFCLLCRYEALKGVGSQCAVPGAAFDCLQPYLGNTVECFASPLNCRFERYYSAFPGLEFAFGSLGSFFGDGPLEIEEGSFEVNPPFVPEVMNFMEQRINQLLSDTTKGPLSFLVVVPDWGGGNSTADMCARSKFKRAQLYISASEHVFADGAQHRVTDRWRPSSWDTAVILLQNDKGQEKWTLDTDKLTNVIKTAFSRSANEKTNEAKFNNGLEDVYAWEARGSRKGGRQGKNVPVKRDDAPYKKKRRWNED